MILQSKNLVLHFAFTYGSTAKKDHSRHVLPGVVYANVTKIMKADFARAVIIRFVWWSWYAGFRLGYKKPLK